MKYKMESKKKGMTLIELLVSLALIAIIALSFMGVFTNSYKNIFDFGRKTKSAMEGSKIMDRIYKRITTDKPADIIAAKQLIVNALNDELYTIDVNYKEAASITDLNVPVGKEHIRYYVSPLETKSGIDGFPVTIMIFKPNSNQKVTYNAFLIKGGL